MVSLLPLLKGRSKVGCYIHQFEGCCTQKGTSSIRKFTPSDGFMVMVMMDRDDTMRVMLVVPITMSGLLKA